MLGQAHHSPGAALTCTLLLCYSLSTPNPKQVEVFASPCGSLKMAPITDTDGAGYRVGEDSLDKRKLPFMQEVHYRDLERIFSALKIK